MFIFARMLIAGTILMTLGNGSLASADTSLPVANGTWNTSLSWVVNQETGEDALRGRMEFVPNAKSGGCKLIRLVQIARMETAPGVDLIWDPGTGEQNRNLLKTKADPSKEIVEGFYVDHESSNCKKGSPCSPYFRDSWANANESADGSSSPKMVPASLIDYPYGWSDFEQISLEACAVCADTFDPMNVEVYGCMQWGGTWPSTGDRTLQGPHYAPDASPTYREALRLFGTFYSAGAKKR